MSPKKERHQIITGVGISIKRPNAPEVLISREARLSSKTCFIC